MLAIRAPDHLGDAVMALPAITALAALGPTVVHTRGKWAGELYDGFNLKGGDTSPVADVGVLLKPSVAAAWRWRHLRRRVGVGRRWLLTDSVPAGGHRREEYARVAGVLGVTGLGMPVYRPRGAATPAKRIALNPWSPTATVRWPHFRALADALGEVVFFAGPGEAEAVRAIAGPHPVVAGLSLPDFAATLGAVDLFISNDSGAAHFAAACGVPVMMIHGSTAPALTGVGTPVEGGPLHCRPCYKKRCPYQLECLGGVSVQAVVEAVQAHLAARGGEG